VEILADTEIEAKERIMDYSSAYALFDIPVLQGRSQELDMEFTNIPELSLDTPSMGDDFDLPSMGDDFDLPSDEIKTDIVLGDLFEIGEHRLLCGDSTDSDQVAKLMNGEKADIMVTDPPYNVAYEGKTKEAMTIQNDKMSNYDFKSFLDSFFSCSLIELKEGAPIYVFCPIEDGAFLNAFLNSGFKLQSILIWLKNTIVMGRKDYNYKHEPILYGWKEGAAHKWYGNFDKSTIIECNKPPRNGEHPTMKPIELLETVLNNSSQSNDLVLDLFLGSGSTMVASHQLKRKCYGMELDPKYCQVIIDRMIKLDPTLEIKKN
jgi:DNA modification methylase